MDSIKAIKLLKIDDDKGSVFHIIKNHNFDIKEVYLSSVGKKIVKGWKQHKLMTLNLVVIKGNVQFSIIKDQSIKKYVIGDSNYCRLIIPPRHWVCFEGLDDENLIINCADLTHDLNEVNLRDFNGYDEDFSNWL